MEEDSISTLPHRDTQKQLLVFVPVVPSLTQAGAMSLSLQPPNSNTGQG